jgi:ABC-2 type transport system ATP-binding protein
MPVDAGFDDKGERGANKMSEAFLVAQELHKSFNEHKAVDGVSFTISRGEIFGLLGPNGAGKTTTIRMLSTVLEPDSGDVTIGGHSVRRDPEDVRKLIGLCPQELALYEELSALDNLVFFGRMAGLDGGEAREQAAAHLELVGLKDRAKGRVDKFSGGMKRRVNLAVSLMGHPELIFMDEPTVGIDPQSRNNIYETIEGLQSKGMTILYTTHYMEEADRLCDRVAIIDGGRIVAMDTPHQLKGQIGPPDRVTLEDVFLKLTGRSLRD